jgi:hypothetical protein
MFITRVNNAATTLVSQPMYTKRFNTDMVVYQAARKGNKSARTIY